MTIALTAFKEKLRRKELYIVSAIGILILLIFGTGSGTLSIDGVAVTDHKILAPILLTVINAVVCMLSVIMSLSTIPNEYERKTSHLIWIRNVSQPRYHGELALANIFSGLASEAILFAAMLIFMLKNGRAAELWRLFPACLIIGVNVAAVCLLTSALSIVLPKFAAGAVSAAAALAGIFHSLLYTLKDIIGGFGGQLIKYALKLIPDLHGIQSQAGNIISGKEIDIHVILTGLAACYIFSVMIILFKRKEA
ncbi:MAG: hypothetical protein ACI4J5_02055 [Oscillospiraceae bacterium]